MLWPRAWPSRRPHWLLLTTCFALAILVPLTLFRRSAYERVDTWITHYTAPAPPPAPKPDFYDWDTRSAFSPVRLDNVGDKSPAELCASFPTHLLGDIQPVLKTGHGVIDSRVRPQLHSVSACLTNLLIFSDLDETVEGREVIDVIADIPANRLANTEQLDFYRTLHGLRGNGSHAEAADFARKGWKVDKFKFLPSIGRAWRMRPGKRWYVFYEADTYVVWDNVFRLLENFDPDVPQYFGSPSPGRDGIWFANGGPGYILSREAMRRVVKDDWDAETGEYLGDMLTERHWDEVMANCCGDSIVGWALWNMTESVALSGLWPMFNPHPPHGVPFSDPYWCQPVITMHKPTEADIVGLWRWQWEHRELTRPLTYRNLALSYHNVTALTTKSDWDNADWDAFPAPVPSDFYDYDPHESPTTCASACAAHPDCLQWNRHLRDCTFVHSIRVGRHREPMVGRSSNATEEAEEAKKYDREELRFQAGWVPEKVRRWVDQRPCEQVQWVRPSVERIF